MDVKNLIAKLHHLERTVLPALQEQKELSAIMKACGLQEVEVVRALQWLENKEILKIHSEKKEVVALDVNGRRYKQEGLPERRLLKVLADNFQPLSVLVQKTKLTAEELTASLGVLKKKVAIEVRKEKELEVKLGIQGKKLQQEKTLEEKLLHKHFPVDVDKLDEEDQFALEELKKRKQIVKVEEKKTVTVELTGLGKELAAIKIHKEVINRLTPGMLKTGEWKKQQFRAYDVEINVPAVHGGRKHFDNEALEYIKQIWLDFGFKEMTGNYVQSAFWDLDALFVPQDHPAREMQDTFYLPGKATLPPLWKKVKEVHESGGDTGSSGWQYPFSQEETELLLLRTHTTVLSAQTLAKLKKEDLPAKFFAVGRVFRNEALDWKHLFEFYQVDGIVVDPNANLRHLKGYLRRFYQKMGFPEVRMRPGHFPYVEPGLEVDVFHPVKKEWVELGGAGIFRPEVVKPLLGFDCPVLAWGQGMGRIIMDYWKLTDIRDLYKNDLKQLREMKRWLK